MNAPSDVFGNYSGSWLKKITNSLQDCEKLRRTALCRGDAKRVFTDYGKHPTYACIGPQPSRNSQDCFYSSTIYGLSFRFRLEVVGVDDEKC